MIMVKMMLFRGNVYSDDDEEYGEVMLMMV